MTRFRAKIGLDNEASQALFASLGYAEAKRVAVFNEASSLRECRLVLNACGTERLLTEASAMQSRSGTPPSPPAPSHAPNCLLSHRFG